MRPDRWLPAGELVGHTLDASGADKRLDRDSEALLFVRGPPESDEPGNRPAQQTVPHSKGSHLLQRRPPPGRSIVD